MQEAVNIIQAFSKTEYKKLKNKLLNYDSILKNLASSVDQALIELDPFKHSLGYCYLLAIKTTKQQNINESFFKQSSMLIEQFHADQIRQVPEYFKIVCKHYLDYARNRTPLKSLKLIRKAINRLAPSKHHLTPLHWMYVQLCIVTKHYRKALELVEEMIFDIDPSTTGVECEDVLLYHYYSGIVFIANNKFNEALHFFKVVLSAPGFVTSQIVIESWKKFILVSLILKGQIDIKLKDISPRLQSCSELFKVYDDLVNAFTNNDFKSLQEALVSGKETFQKDHNYGLAKRVIKAFKLNNIAKLTKIYSTLSLDEIISKANLTSEDNADSLIYECVEKGLINASISHKDNIVSFSTFNESFINRKTLDSKIRETMDLHNILERYGDQISLSMEYIEKTYAIDRGILMKLKGDDDPDDRHLYRRMMKMDDPIIKPGLMY